MCSDSPPGLKSALGAAGEPKTAKKAVPIFVKPGVSGFRPHFPNPEMTISSRVILGRPQPFATCPLIALSLWITHTLDPQSTAGAWTPAVPPESPA